jgi:hypothetical protein
MFTVGAVGPGQVSGANLAPGDTAINCVKVTYTGALPSTVKLFASSVSGVNGSGGTGVLAYLHVKIEEGTGGSFGTCAGFAASSTLWNTGTHGGVGSDLLGVFPTTYATGPSSGVASWTNPTSRVYRITMQLDAATPSTSHGGSASATFNWQAENT